MFRLPLRWISTDLPRRLGLVNCSRLIQILGEYCQRSFWSMGVFVRMLIFANSNNVGIAQSRQDAEREEGGFAHPCKSYSCKPKKPKTKD